MRRTVFLYDDGIVLCATLRALEEIGVLERSLARRSSLAELLPDVVPSGIGYMRAGLRSLAGEGWISFTPALDPAEIFIEWNELAAKPSATAPITWRWESSWRGSRAPHRMPGRGLGALNSCAGSTGWPSVARSAGRSTAARRCPRRSRSWWSASWTRRWSFRSCSGCLRQAGVGEESPQLPDNEFGGGAAKVLAALNWIDGSGRWTGVGLLAKEYSVHFGIACILSSDAGQPDLSL